MYSSMCSLVDTDTSFLMISTLANQKIVPTSLIIVCIKHWWCVCQPWLHPECKALVLHLLAYSPQPDISPWKHHEWTSRHASMVFFFHAHACFGCYLIRISQRAPKITTSAVFQFFQLSGLHNGLRHIRFGIQLLVHLNRQLWLLQVQVVCWLWFLIVLCHELLLE
jgi:hypothetical protein